MIDDRELPIYDYNYAALLDWLKKKGKAHNREVLTAAITDLIQYDAPLHKCSPYAAEKWISITSIDNCTRMLIYADLVPEENSGARVKAARSVLQTFGLPFRITMSIACGCFDLSKSETIYGVLITWEG